MRDHRYFVYILSSPNRVLYIGVTGDLFKRINEHRTKYIGGFTAKYNVGHLLYYEEYGDVNMAIGREKQIKGWRRDKKLTLIRTKNPERRDLAKDLFF